MIRGKYKLVEWYDSSIGNSDERPSYELFDLEEDPAEEHDLNRSLPEERDAMAASLKRWRQEVGAQEMILNPNFDPTRGGQRSEPPPGDTKMRTFQ